MSGALDTLRDERGYTLAIVLFTVVLLASLALSLSSQTLLSRRLQDRDLDLDRAAYVARAGYERACAETLLPASDWSSLPADVFTAEPFADGSFTVALHDQTTDTVTVESVARVRDAVRTLRFASRRDTTAGPTPGVALLSIQDPSLDSLD